MPATCQRLAYIDSLRGIAAVGVLTIHSAFLSGHVNEYTSLGQRGVQLFYIISALTLFLSLNGSPFLTPREWRDFYLRRFFRVAPLYYFAVAANCLYQKLGQGAAAPLGLPVADLAMGLTFVNGWNARTINSIAIGGWSVAVEATFYFILPVIYMLVTNLRGALWFFCASSVATYSLSNALADNFEFLWFPIQLPVFAMGIVVYFLRQELESGICSSAAVSTRAAMRSWSLLCLMASAGFIWASWPTRDQTLFLSSVGLSFLVVAFGLHTWTIVVNPVTVYLGRISYSIYLTHFFVVFAIDGLLPARGRGDFVTLAASVGSFFAIWCALLAGTVVVSTITYHTIEAPFIEWGRNMTGTRERHGP